MKPSLTSRYLAGAALLACGLIIGPLLSGCGGGSAFAGPLPQPNSPQGRILFSRDNQLRIINADGTGERVVPNTEGFTYGKISPDGTKFLSSQGVNDNVDVYAVNIDGTTTQRLTTDPAGDGQPVWSGDGKKIAFCSGRLLNPSGQRNTDIFTMNADGSGQKVLANTDGEECPAEWSLDNNFILYFSNKRTGLGSSLFVIGADGQNDRVVKVVGRDGIFAPNSRGIIQSAGTNFNEVVLIDFNGDFKSRLFSTSDLSDITVSTLSPDRKKIAFGAVQDGQRNLYTSNLDGTERHKIVSGPVFDVSWGGGR